MSRIRTIKPEFFTSADIVSLSPLARLFYVSLWCESDREGRFKWDTRTLKMRYMPGDTCDIADLANELIDAGLVVLYEVDGKDYAEIPTFKSHQVINNRESESTIPPRVKGASKRVSAEGRKEGKERKEIKPPIPPLQGGDDPKEDDEDNEDADPVIAKRTPITLKAYIESCKQAGTAPIPEGDPVFAYVAKSGIPEDYLRLQWLEFKARYVDEPRRQKSWPRKFLNSVRGNWYGLWAMGPNGSYFLTTKGKQADNVHKDEE